MMRIFQRLAAKQLTLERSSMRQSSDTANDRYDQS
jgi:hypothetical protein